MSAKDRKKKARSLIQQALSTYFEEEIPLPNDLTVSAINKSVVAIVLFLELSGGSTGDIDLYALLQTYLLDPSKRAEINQILSAK